MTRFVVMFSCMLAYYVEWHMREKLAPVLFDDHERDKAEATRASIVEPAPRSKAARAKDGSNQTEDGMPVYSFAHDIHGFGNLGEKPRPSARRDRVRILRTDTRLTSPAARWTYSASQRSQNQQDSVHASGNSVNTLRLQRAISAV